MAELCDLSGTVPVVTSDTAAQIIQSAVFVLGRAEIYNGVRIGGGRRLKRRPQQDASCMIHVRETCASKSSGYPPPTFA